ncbi:MAG: GAF domain-containing protein [Deltaproteobacteria bacterium]|nr:GAF domain-containing protein [Deltaproteobacteria bacterium]
MSGKSRAPQSVGRSEEAAAPEGLLEQRETFIQTFFKKGAELTEELLKEDQRLRARMHELEAENAALRAQVASDDAIRDLLTKISHLEKEKKELISRVSHAQASSSEFSSRFAEIEAENAQLASLYVASHQLHSTLDPRSIVRQLKELLAQFVGARAFAVYLVDDDRHELAPICSEGVVAASLRRVPLSDGALWRAVGSGAASWVEGDATRGTIDAPAATIPMLLNGKAIGVIAVFATFEQKREFIDVDFELFKLLGAHAASALVAGRLFAEHGAKVGAVEAFLDLE